MGPYRTPSPPPAAPESPSDDRMLAGVIAATGAIPVALAVAEHAVFGAQASIGLALLVLGVVGMVRR